MAVVSVLVPRAPCAAGLFFELSQLDTQGETNRKPHRRTMGLAQFNPPRRPFVLRYPDTEA
jgi:hypothetical protein